VLAALTLGLTAGTVAPASAATYTGSYSNTGAITIPDSGDASPSPAVITVPADSGVTSVGDVSVTLHGVSHTAVDDLYVWVVSPTDTEVDLLCEQGVRGTSAPLNVDVTFTTDGSGEAACGDFGSDPTDFAGEDPTGDWQLFVYDAYEGDAGQVAGGWSLSFGQEVTPTVTTDPKDANVGLGQTATFTAEASGSPKPFVQWQVSKDAGTTWTDIPGADKRTYTTGWLYQSNDQSLYRAEFYTPTSTVDSKAATVRVFRAPSAPQGVSASQTGDRQVSVSWAAPTDPGSAPISGYHVSATNGGSSSSATVGPDARSAVLDLAPGSTYTVSVTAQYPAGDGPAGTTSVTPRATLTIAPNRTTATAGDTLMFRGSGQAGERVYLERSVAGGAYVPVVSNTVAPQGVYLISVKATNTASYRVRGATSLVSPGVLVTVTSKTSMAAKRVSLRKYTLYGTVSPVKANLPVKVYSKKSNGAYAYLGTARTGSTGRWSYTRRYSASKTMVFKAAVPATDRNAAGFTLLRVSVH
jgi:subtilisin-like proprotein convertase family protein